MAGRFSISVLAIIPDKFNRVLMVRYSENGDWTLPGGPVRDGENLQGALVRAVRERTGLSIEVGQLFDTHKELNQGVVSYFFICRETGGILTLSPKAVEFGVFGLEDIPASIDPLIRRRLFTYWRDPRPNPSAAVVDLEPENVGAQPVAQTVTVIAEPVAEPVGKIVEPATKDWQMPPPATPVALPKLPGPEATPVPAPAPPKVKKPRRKFFWLGPVIVALAAILLYSITRRGYFLADDYIILNQLTFKQTSFLDNLVWFTRDWGVGVDFYRPWIRLAYYFQFLFFADNPAGWHLFSAALHTLNSLLVYLMALLLVRRRGVATVAGLVFAWQPIHTEPVAWISGQTDLWATFFSLTSTCAFVRVRQLQRMRRPHLWLYLLALFSFLMALFSKEAALALPVALVAYDLVSSGLDRVMKSRGEPEEGWRWQRIPFTRLLLYQLPFWLLLVGYIGLRFALFKGLGGYDEGGQLPDFGLFVRSYLRWLAYPFTLGGTDGLILLGAALAFLALAGIQEWERFRVARGEPVVEEDNPASQVTRRSRASFWNLRTALYGVLWAGIFLLPAALTAPAERFTYLPSVGFALFLGVCLAPFSPRLPERELKIRFRPRYKLREYFDMGILLRLSAVTAVLIAYFATANARVHDWNDAGYTAQNVLKLTKEVIPGVVHYSVFISEGVPESGNNALIFRTGYTEAVQLLYRDPTLEVQRVAHFPIVAQKLDRTIFLQYRDDRLINHQEVVKTLLERNANLKQEKPAQTWNFANQTDEDIVNSRTSWTEISGQGLVQTRNGTLQVISPGAAEVQSPGLNLPAAELGSVEITFKAVPRTGTSAKAFYRMSVSWEPQPTGEPREAPQVGFDIEADGQFHTYRITPPVLDNYNYTDVIAYLRLQVPADLQEVSIQLVRQNSIPLNYANLAG